MKKIISCAFIFFLSLVLLLSPAFGSKGPLEAGLMTKTEVRETLESLNSHDTDKRNFGERFRLLRKAVKSIKNTPEYKGLVKKADIKKLKSIRGLVKQKDARAFSSLDSLIEKIISRLKSTKFRTRPLKTRSESQVLPEGLLYSRYIVREARLQGKLVELQKADYYQEKDSRPSRNTQTLASLLDRIDGLIQAGSDVPGYSNIDFTALEGLMAQAEAIAQSIDQAASSGIIEPADQDGKVYFGLTISKDRDIFLADSPMPALVREYGFDFVAPNPSSTDLTMSMTTPREGVYAFDKYTELSSHFAAHGLDFRLPISDSGFKSIEGEYWLKAETDEVTWVNSQGITADRSGSHSALNIWNPVVVKWVTDYTSALARAMKNNPNIAVYELFNEPVMRLKNEPVGYGQRARQAFQVFLDETYQHDINKLNQYWGKQYQAFSEAVPPADLVPNPDPHHTAQIYDFGLFRQQSHIDYFGRIISEIKKEDQNTPVCSQFFERIRKREPKKGREAVGRGVNFYGMARLNWDILGNHDWPSAKQAVDLLYTYCINRYAQHRLWNDEFIWTAPEGFSDRGDKMFTNKGEILLRRVLARNIWRHLAWSHTGLIFSKLDRFWPGWNNSLFNVQSQTVAMRYCSGVIPVIKARALEISSYLSHSNVKNHGIYILCSNISDLVGYPFQTSIGLIQDMVSDFLGRNIIPFLVPEDAIIDGSEDLKGCRLLICPYTTHMDLQACSKILKWVEDGGRILLIGPCGRYEQHGSSIDGLTKALFNIQPIYSVQTGAWTENGQALQKLQKAYGSGLAKLFPGAEYGQVKSDLISEAEPYRYVVSDQPDFEVIPKETSTGESVIVVINLDPVNTRVGKISVKGGYTIAYDVTVRRGMEAIMSPGSGSVSFSVKLPPGDASVFLLKTTNPSRPRRLKIN